MNFTGTRDKLKGLLLGCGRASRTGINEVCTSKADVPSSLPAGILQLASRHGEVKLMTGYANQKYRFDIFIVLDECENADEQMIEIIENIDKSIQDAFFVEIDKVEIYDSLLSAKSIKVAKFEVVV